MSKTRPLKACLAVALTALYLPVFASHPCPVVKPFKTLAHEAVPQYALPRVLSATKPPTHPTPRQKSTSNPTPITLVNFWASWCAPCQAELPLLDALQQSGRANVILINIGDGDKAANATLNESNIKYLQTHLGDDALLSQLALPALPASILYRDKMPTHIGIGKLQENTHQWLKCLSLD